MMRGLEVTKLGGLEHLRIAEMTKPVPGICSVVRGMRAELSQRIAQPPTTHPLRSRE